jgi:hypothetical protein
VSIELHPSSSNASCALLNCICLYLVHLVVLHHFLEMSSSLRAPEPFSFGASDLAAQWGIWRRQFSWYLVATNGGLNVDEEQMVGVLITLLGSEGLKIYDTFVFTDAADARKIEPVLDKFTAYFEPRRSEVFERFKFLRRHQLPGETFDAWLIDLRGLVKTCGYGTGVDSVLRDQIVLGVADPLVREKLLYEKDLQLATACEIVRACESSKAQLSQIATSSTAEAAHAVRVDLVAGRLKDSQSRRSELSMSSNRPLINTQPSSIPSVKIAAGLIGKISVESPILRVLIVVWSAIYPVAVRNPPSPARCQHVQHQTPRPMFMLWRRRHTGLVMSKVAVRRWPSRGQLKKATTSLMP